MGSAQLPAAITAKFAIRVHPRSVERALARAESSKMEAGKSTMPMTADPRSWTAMSSCAPGCEFE